MKIYAEIIQFFWIKNSKILSKTFAQNKQI